MIFVKSALTLIAVTSTASALSIRPLSSQHVPPLSTTALHLEDPRTSRQKELDGLQSKRDQLKAASMASAQPKGGPEFGRDIERMSKDQLKEYMASLGNTDLEDNIESMLAGELSFKTKRVASSKAKGGGGRRASTANDGENEEDSYFFIDYTEDRFYDENMFHIPNRIGFSTIDWSDVNKGFVNGKLKKADRKMGKFNKADLKKAYTKLEKSGVTLIESSVTYGNSDSLLKKINKNVALDEGPDIASIFPNPWKYALRTRSRPRVGADAICNAAEQACERLGVTQMTLFQVENPWYYIGGTKAVGRSMMEVMQEGHAQNVGCVDMSVKKLYKLQKFLTNEGEMLATNQFEFSLTNRQNIGMINACKKLDITPICRNVLDGGLASGKYTPTTPTGGIVSSSDDAKGPYSLRQLEKLDALFQTMEKLTETVSKRIKTGLLDFDKESRPDINTKITTTQIAINYVRAKGAVPLVSVTNPREANELLGCLGWELDDDEVDELEKACKVCGI